MRKKEDPAPVNLNDEELAQQLTQLAKKNWTFYAAIVGGLLAIILGFATSQVFFCIIGFAILFVTIFVFSSKASKRRKLITDNVITGTLHEIFNTETYEPNGHLDRKEIEDTGLVDDWNDMYGDDYFKGSYKGMNIRFSDIKLNKVETDGTDEDATQTTTRKFAGQWIVCSTKRHLDNRLRVMERYKTISGGYSKSLSDVETENADFNNKYQILTDDPHTAFLILTPQFMEFINYADTVAEGQIRLCFTGDVLYFTIDNGKNLFSAPSIANDVNAIRESIRKDALYLTNILDELLKNDYLFGSGS